MTKFIILLLCFTVATSQRSGNSIIKGPGYSQNEIQRQNRITQRIIANFLERKLFPYRRPQHEVPTIDEILPLPAKDPPSRTRYNGAGGRRRFRPKSALDLLQRTRSGFRPSNPKYGASTNNSEQTSSSLLSASDEEDHEDKIPIEDYYDEDYADDGDANQEENQSGGGNGTEGGEDGEESEGRSRRNNGTVSELLSGRGGAGIGDYDDYGENNYETESLQSVESEHLDLFYRTHRDHNKRFNGQANPFYFDDEFYEDCPNCVDDQQVPNRWTMPLTKLGEKRYYLGVFFKANWYKAAQYCRFHGMHLASISSQEENDRLEKHVRDFGFGNEHFWTSGTDLADEGSFFWMATGRPITFTNWNAGEPNNFRYENNEEENCLELWNRDGKGLKWNDSPCSFETYFVCEVQ